jgi:hypothetical protein
METTTTKIDEGSLEKHPEPEISTNLNVEIINSEIVSQTPDVEMKNLKISSTKQPKIDQFLGLPTKGEKRPRPAEIFSAPAKKQSSTSKVKRKGFDFTTSRTNLFPEKPFVFSGESNETTDQQPKPASASDVSDGNNNTAQPKVKPPPIHISTGSAVEIRKLANEINNQPRSFEIEIKKDKIKTKVVKMDSWNDYNSFIKLLQTKQHHFHTYSSQEPQLKYVIYGLPTMEIEDLEKELQVENIRPDKIVKMRMKQRGHEQDDDQNYLLYFNKDGGQKGNFLTCLREVKNIGGFKVRFAAYKTKQSGPSQCSKCLQFGHGQRGCNKPQICLRCSEQHDYKNCPYISKETNKVPEEKLKCHFCGEKHTGISPICKVRLQIIEKWKAKSTNGNNRNQNKPVGHQHQGQRGHQRNIPPTERVNRSAQYNQQSSHSASVPSTSTSQSVAVVKAKQQNNITVSTQKPVAQRNQSNRTNQKRRARKNRNRKNKPGKVNQLNKPKPVDEEMELEAEELPETSVNENSAETTTSVNIPAESNSDERTSESETSRLMYLINELLKIFTKNPGCLKLVEQAIGLFARNTSN